MMMVQFNAHVYRYRFGNRQGRSVGRDKSIDGDLENIVSQGLSSTVFRKKSGTITYFMFKNLRHSAFSSVLVVGALPSGISAKLLWMQKTSAWLPHLLENSSDLIPYSLVYYINTVLIILSFPVLKSTTTLGCTLTPWPIYFRGY